MGKYPEFQSLTDAACKIYISRYQLIKVLKPIYKNRIIIARTASSCQIFLYTVIINKHTYLYYKINNYNSNIISICILYNVIMSFKLEKNEKKEEKYISKNILPVRFTCGSY